MKTSKIGLLLCAILMLSSCGLFKGIGNRESGNSASKKAKIVINAAKSYLGTPYKYGGTTAEGYDCSGLVYVSFQEAGITLPRTSIEQANVGSEVSLERVKPGDLVFFVTKKEAKISHVGIVTEIKGPEVTLFIHAANSGVQEDNIYSKYYRSTFAKAMRPF
jgi:cell wall-associated NlpC family hydrolase